MNIFSKVAQKYEGDATKLGCRSKDEGHKNRRMAAMAAMNPNGFRQYKKEPRLDAQGMTRGQRKRAAEAKRRSVAREQIEQSRKALSNAPT